MKLIKSELKREWSEESLTAFYSQDLVIDAGNGMQVKMNMIGDVAFGQQLSAHCEEAEFFDGSVEVTAFAANGKEMQVSFANPQAAEIRNIMRKTFIISDDKGVRDFDPEFTGHIKIDYDFSESVQKKIKDILDVYLEPALRNERAVPRLTM
jgi:hypothetical protein